MTRLPLGKLPSAILESTVVRLRGAATTLVATRPGVGLDFAAIRVSGGYIVVSADPVTGVTENIGAHAVNVSANDVATSGNRPQFAESVILMPEGYTTDDLTRLARQMHFVAKRLGIAIVGGHSEVAPRIKSPIVVFTVFSFVENYVSSSAAVEGDSILMTKSAGIEGTAALAYDTRLEGMLQRKTLRRARGFFRKMSVVEEAVAAFRTGVVHAMHDCTEGGVLGAVFEMSVASGQGFLVSEDLIPVARETREVCEVAGVEPLKLISSGSLLIAVRGGEEDEVVRALKGISSVVKIGEFRGSGRSFVRGSGRAITIRDSPEDELWRFLRRS